MKPFQVPKVRGYSMEGIIVIPGNPPQYKCKVCHRQWVTKAHIHYHHGCGTNLKRFPCQHCNFSAGSRTHLEYHTVAVHTGDRSHACEVCGKAFFQKAKLTRHQSTHAPHPSFPCDTCDKGFRTHAGLQSHQRKHHFQRNNMFNAMVPHEKQPANLAVAPYQCEVCGMGFLKPWMLQLHVERKQHGNDIRRHSCPHCPKKFVSPKDVRRHIIVHTRERNFPCNLCSFVSNRKDNLLRHSRTQHFEGVPSLESCQPPEAPSNSIFSAGSIDDGAPIPPLACSKCGMGFYRARDLTTHTILKHADAPRSSVIQFAPKTPTITRGDDFICQICGLVFSLVKELHQHLATVHKIDTVKVRSASATAASSCSLSEN